MSHNCQQRQWFNGVKEVQYHNVYNIQVKPITAKLVASAILAWDLKPDDKSSSHNSFRVLPNSP
jgi:hypothetical protein